MTLKRPKQFWCKVHPQPNGCWEWRGTVVGGYGQGKFQGANARVAHRIAWEETRGPVPPGMVLDHLCRNRVCVNPDHLEPVSPRENIVRGIGPSAINAKKTHCDAGHEFTRDNTYLNPRGSRICKTCRLARDRASYVPKPRSPHYNSLKTHCDHGHPFTPENTVRESYGKYARRICRTCRNERARDYGRNKRAAAR